MVFYILDDSFLGGVGTGQGVKTLNSKRAGLAHSWYDPVFEYRGITSPISESGHMSPHFHVWDRFCPRGSRLLTCQMY